MSETPAHETAAHETAAHETAAHETAAHETAAQPRWRILVTPRWIGWHVFAVATVIGMSWLGDWQLRRALAGNTLSWAYTFEWPLFAIFGVFFWAKTVRDELRPVQAAGGQRVVLPAGAYRGAGDSAGAGDGAGQDPDGQEEPELAEYNAYLAKLNKEVRGHGRWHGLR